MPGLYSLSEHMGYYDYKKSFYTGTKQNPDDLIFFVKKDAKKFEATHCFENEANFFGKMPIIGYFCGARRVANATSSFFKHLKSKETVEKNAYWMDFKNLSRGLLEVLPGTGLIHLIYDAIKEGAHQHNISKQLKDKNNIAGIAFNGKLVCTIDLDALDKFINKVTDEQNISSERKLLILETCCKDLIQKVNPDQHDLDAVLKAYITHLENIDL